jgi:hypothetical protein
LQQNILLDSRIDLQTEFLFILLETRKFDSHNVVTGEQIGKVILTFHVADALNFLVTKAI